MAQTARQRSADGHRELLKRIKAVYHGSYETYGTPRVCLELKAQGVACSVNRVARLMRLEDLQARQSREYKSSTMGNNNHLVAPDLLKRDFTAHRPDHKWLADITSIRTGEGWLYLATILDLFARRIAGWAMSHRMTSELTLAALKMALRRRQPGGGLIYHFDQGSQYTDGTCQALLEEHGFQISMNGVGTWYDNAPMEGFFATSKSQLVNHRVYRTRVEAKTDLFFYIEGFCNRRRRDSSLFVRLSPRRRLRVAVACH